MTADTNTRDLAAPPAAAARGRGRGQRGVASLLVVMALFFIVSLVAAYASRNLIFEQRISANQYRGNQAFEAAEAGLEWALGLLNAGRVDSACQPSTTVTDGSFRDRYLRFEPNGVIQVRTYLDAGFPQALTVDCVRSTTGWACNCPDNGPPSVVPPTVEGSFPAFRVEFRTGLTPGQFDLRSTGCSAYDVRCLRGLGVVGSTASATVLAAVSLASAMPTTPTAALTVRGNVDLGAHPLRVANPDTRTQGVTVHAGGNINLPAAVLQTVPGGAGGAGTMIEGDAMLAGWTADRMFQSFFGVDRATYRRHPSTLSVTCGADCTAAVTEAVAQNPGRPLWIEGDLVLDGPLALGSPMQPVLLVVTGRVVLNDPGARIVGIVYSQAPDWAATGSGLVEGAVLAEGNLIGGSAMNVVYDADTVARVRLAVGSVIRVPGGWRDF